MVKYSGRVRHQTGSQRQLGYVGKGCNGTNYSKTGNKYNCKNKIYGARKGGKKGKGIPKNYCKKHFDLLTPKGWPTKNKNDSSENDRWFIYPKDHFKKNTNISTCQKSACYTVGYNIKNDLMLCRFHYERS